MATGGGMVWSAALASRLPGSPVAVKESGSIVSEQPRSPRVLKTEDTDEAESSLRKDMKEKLFDLKLLMEYKLLGEQYIPGVYILPSQQTLCEWHGVIFVHDGPWKGGIYRFSLIIPDKYPQVRPMFRFRTNIMHPYVKHKNGQVNLYRIMPEWNPLTNHLYEVVIAVKNSFLLSDVWQLDDKEEEKEMLESFRKCARDSVMLLSRDQDDMNGPENLLRLVDGGDEVVKKAQELVHSQTLPTGKELDSSGTGVLDQLSTSFTQFIGKVIGK